MTCVSVLSLCDAIPDCRFGEDEHFCHPAIPVCPINCSCLLYVLSCMGLNKNIFTSDFLQATIVYHSAMCVMVITIVHMVSKKLGVKIEFVLVR